jgi:hypothetical protein
LYYVIDRWEGDVAVCQGEDMKMVEIPRSALPEGCAEGAKIEARDGGYHLVDNAEDRERVRAKLRRLFEKGTSESN